MIADFLLSGKYKDLFYEMIYNLYSRKLDKYMGHRAPRIAYRPAGGSYGEARGAANEMLKKV
jgi:hypothetical protein